MSTAALLLKEIRHRKLNFVLSLVVVAIAVALFVAMLTMGRASERETRRLMRNLGFNLLVLPKSTDMVDFWSSDEVKDDMPEEYVVRLARSEAFDADHFVARYQKKIRWKGRRVLLTGVRPALGAIGRRKKSPMGFRIEPGTCYLGYELARGFHIRAGQTIRVLGKDLVVKRCLLEDGSKEDIRIYASLRDVQAMLGKEGRITEIQALGCQCYGATVATLRSQLMKLLPETKVTEFRTIALARAEQRERVQRYAGFIVAAVLLAAVVWVGVLAWLNVRERRQEIGILRALGLSTGRIAALFLGKAVLLGLVCAGLGFGLGTAIALQFGHQIFRITSEKIVPIYEIFGWALLLTPVVTTLGSLLPTVAAVTEDPAVTLGKE